MSSSNVVNPKNSQPGNGMKRMWQLAFTKKALAISACLLSVISVAVSFVPFIAVYYIIRELAMNMSDPSGLNGAYMIRLPCSYHHKRRTFAEPEVIR